ncbi:T6SS phospholipase effector Tle1-like catalytic domain-containing protein [Tahibacter amnicola]|uniref:DUF2235 domain-containing protein n=1 Tax=Tahibacter amnicola TaxID=2976241 RepID=A0ABY6BK22_9GAMM|nr:DUF2235 domain-containing protein [Tahibacter amnicola]UXI70244.1 DUF2235 domain-containing protein [Tahibacter amnicola]
MPSRRLVICIDGTSNAPGEGMTNIQRLNRMLARDENQVVYYQPGVGTVEPESPDTRWDRRWLMFLDATTGYLMKRHVCSAYRYLMAEYREDDLIYGFGFSRGAYALRVLIGMIRKVGLLHRGQEEMVDFAWRTYAQRGNDDAAKEFRNAFSRFVPKVRFLGLFDTVSAVGTPWRPQIFDYTFTNDRVETVRHALALDEHRVMFVQNLWNSEPGAPTAERRTDVRQVWFAGAHADVGGGYPEAESGLSRIPLAWMRDHAQQAGLEFRPKLSARMLTGDDASEQTDMASITAANAAATAHDELRQRPWWYLLEWLPIPRWRPDGRGGGKRRWYLHRARPRFVPEQSLIHGSVKTRASQMDYVARPRLVRPGDEPEPTNRSV